MSVSVWENRILNNSVIGYRVDGEEKEKMAVTMKHMSLIVSAFGVLSFLFGVIAENKKV